MPGSDHCAVWARKQRPHDSCYVAIVKASKVVPFQARLKQFCLVIRDQGWLLEYLS